MIESSRGSRLRKVFGFSSYRKKKNIIHLTISKDIIIILDSIESKNWFVPFFCHSPVLLISGCL